MAETGGTGPPSTSAAGPLTEQHEQQERPVTAHRRRRPVFPKLARLGPAARAGHTFSQPAKRIHDGADVAHFLASTAYRDLGVFLLQLNHSVLPRAVATTTTTVSGSGSGSGSGAGPSGIFTLDAPRDDPPAVLRLQQLLARTVALIDEAPPDPGPRRFGNASFRVWHRLLGERVDAMLDEMWGAGGAEAGKDVGNAGGEDEDENARPATAQDEVREYFLGSFGSSQRLDYGTGHELSFLAFLGCLWKLGYFGEGDADEEEAAADYADADVEAIDDEAVERSIVLGVVEPYLQVVRRLILTYTLEPAGSHGVWGLDDHAFLPYIFGSAQLAAPVGAGVVPGGWATPQAGSAPRAPKTTDVLRPAAVAAQRARNLYFSAVAFIGDVKRGPFWEHSPILYDVSGIRDGWGKINKGMLKMYHAEVLAKFPVVQHFPFGSLFAWDLDPNAAAPAPSVHLANQPAAGAVPGSGPTGMPPPGVSMGIPYSRVPPPPAMGTMPPPGGAGRGTTAAQSSITRAPWAR